VKSYSILREKEDEKLSQLQLTGRVLDLGGHKQSSYYHKIQSQMPIEVVNLDKEQTGTHKVSSGADHVFDLEEAFPLGAEIFNAVICINVLEHIYNYRNLLTESNRVLRNGGTIHITVPFFFNIHGSPNDYFRYTRSALERMLTETGFINIKIEELGDGPCSVVFQTFGGSIPTLTIKLLLKRLVVRVDKFLASHFSRYSKIKARVPLGYYVQATK